MERYAASKALQDIGTQIKSISDLESQILDFWLNYGKCDTQTINVEQALMLSHHFLEAAINILFVHFYQVKENREAEKQFYDLYQGNLETIYKRMHIKLDNENI